MATSRNSSVRNPQWVRQSFPTPQLTALNPAMTFDEAFDVWLSFRVLTVRQDRFSRARYISERTEWDYRQYARTLGKMFGGVKLEDIDFSGLQTYHAKRALGDAPWSQQAGPNRIRKEVGLLTRVMRAASAWTEELEHFFEPLQIEESDIQRALTPQEQERFLSAAASSEDYSFVYHYTIGALQTSCSTNELRTLRVGDVDIHNQVLTVRTEGAKNKFRRRSIPLVSDEVLWAFERLTERAVSLGACSPQHYLFPKRTAKVGKYDPSLPMSDCGLRKRWEAVRTLANLPWLRPYDLRHTSITRMAEAGVPIATIMSMAGHMSLKMQQHYTTISSSAKQQALAATWSQTIAPYRHAPENRDQRPPRSLQLGISKRPAGRSSAVSLSTGTHRNLIHFPQQQGVYTSS